MAYVRVIRQAFRLDQFRVLAARCTARLDQGGIDSRGRIKIESKDDMRKRGLPSPDRADAMAIAFAGRANAAPMDVESHAGEKRHR